MCIKSGMNANGFYEAPDEQPGTCKQYEGDGDFGNYESAVCPAFIAPANVGAVLP